jgi:broad specificity phosphatase PhoE
MKYLLITRHVESSKNINDKFASDGDREALTPGGARLAEFLGKQLVDFISFLNEPSGVTIVSSESRRAFDTAMALAVEIGAPITIEPRLQSLTRSSTVGLTYSEFLIRDPLGAHELNLYRAGLFDSYEMRRSGEELSAFEARVVEVVRELASASIGVGILVSHRSTISACLINIARQAYDYPPQFFGYVPIDFGASALIDLHSKPWKILFANIIPSDLNVTGRVLTKLPRG